MTISRYKRNKPLSPEGKEKSNVFTSLPFFLVTDYNDIHTNVVTLLPLEDRYSLSRVDTALSFFCRSSAGEYIGKFIQATLFGNEDTVLQMLQRNPSLLKERGHLERGKTTDYSGRVYSGLTAYQLALCAGDDVMAKKMKSTYLAKCPNDTAKLNAETELDKQFDEVFPNGYQAHLKQQKTNTFNFDAIVSAIESATPEELQAALNNPNDVDSKLGRALVAFRQAFTAQSLNEKVFNPNHLQKAFELYDGKFNAWYVNDNNPHRWLKLDLFWRQVIGHAERYLPANYMQAFCTGLGNIVYGGRPLERTLTAYNYITHLSISVFPLDSDPVCRLGGHFGLCSYYSCDGGAHAWRRWGRVGSFPMPDVFSKLMLCKNNNIGRITLRAESQRRLAPGCVIQ